MKPLYHLTPFSDSTSLSGGRGGCCHCPASQALPRGIQEVGPLSDAAGPHAEISTQAGG